MIEIRSRDERGHTQLDWLDSRHTFSFDEYHHPKYMSFRSLRVINEDIVEPGKGFRTHSHRDMEIVTYILKGALEHQDSLGSGSVIRPGEIQRMSAGTGISHSEFNHSQSEPVHLLQIWILPEKKGLKPEYEQTKLEPDALRGTWYLAGSRSGQGAAVTIHQDVDMFVTVLEANAEIQYKVRRKRSVWLQVARGEVILNDVSFAAGDGAAVSDEATLEILSVTASELLLFDLA